MLKINERTIEAVAALLYNNIYDLASDDEGAWCVEDRHKDGYYLAFAESLLQAVRDTPDVSAHDTIERDVELTNRNRKVGPGWATIVIDQEYAYLPDETEKFFSEVRNFIADPGLIYLESNFLDFDQDIDEEKESNEHVGP